MQPENVLVSNTAGAHLGLLLCVRVQVVRIDEQQFTGSILTLLFSHAGLQA